MGLLDDIYAQAQARSSKSETFIPPLINHESQGSDVVSQILNACNAAQGKQGNQGPSGKGSSDNGLPWYFDNRNLRPDRLFMINPDPSTLNTPQASNTGSSSPNMWDTSQFNFTANDLVNMRFNKSIPKQDYKVAKPYQFNPSDLQNYDPKASPLDYYKTSEFDNYNAYNFANNKIQESTRKYNGEFSSPYAGQKYDETDKYNLNPYNISGITLPVYLENDINKGIADSFLDYNLKSNYGLPAYTLSGICNNVDEILDNIFYSLRSIGIIPQNTKMTDSIKKIGKYSHDYGDKIFEAPQDDSFGDTYGEITGGQFTGLANDVVDVPYKALRGWDDAEKNGENEVLGYLSGGGKALGFLMADFFTAGLSHGMRTPAKAAIGVTKAYSEDDKNKNCAGTGENNDNIGSQKAHNAAVGASQGIIDSLKEPGGDIGWKDIVKKAEKIFRKSSGKK